MNGTKKPWGGRFTAATDGAVEAFTASVRYDRRLAPYDIKGSIAHATMLAHTGILDEPDSERIIEGLRHIADEIERGDFHWSEALEDVHMNIEARLVELTGDAGKKLHTARSRNDQVATATRLYLRDACDALCAQLCDLRHTLIGIAARETHTIMSGLTHLQGAQPVTLGHHLLAWAEMLERDFERLRDCRKRVNVSPLGAAALAGTGFAIDREYSASLLGFEGVARNSLDAVSDRDFVIEFNACTALLAVHLSRIAEELVLWCSDRFGYITPDDAFCTGSSIMPQKKNPDVAELIRARSGRVCGALVALLMVMKGQPLAYNRDNQEDKEPLFDGVDTVGSCVTLLNAMMQHLEINREVMRGAALDGFATATDLADYLVRGGAPFRDAHETTGRIVRYCMDNGLRLEQLDLDQLRAFSAGINDDVFAALSLEGSVAARDHIGGTAPQAVARAAAAAATRLAEQRAALSRAEVDAGAEAGAEAGTGERTPR